MIDSITTEIYWLILTITMTGLLWIPQIIHSVITAGPTKAFLYPDEATKHYADWAKRSKAAHHNAVENLIIFAPLTILVVTLGAENAMTAISASVYFFVRLVHYFMHTLAVPLMRTLMFLVGFTCQIVMALTIFNVL
jgi:uncharacterized MAPEG superfamily protein